MSNVPSLFANIFKNNIGVSNPQCVNDPQSFLETCSRPMFPTLMTTKCVHHTVHMRAVGMKFFFTGMEREKEGDLTQSYDKDPYTNRKFENEWTTQNATNSFDYTTIADRLRAVSWSHKSHPTGVVKPVYGYQTNRKFVDNLNVYPNILSFLLNLVN